MRHRERANRTARGSRAAALGGILALLCPLLPRAAAAQRPVEADPVAVAVGDRVRVTTDAAGPEVGWIEALGPGTLRLVRQRDHEVVPLPPEAIRRLEVSRVRRSSTEQAAPGMILGGLLGLAAGIAVTEESSCNPESPFCFDFGSEKLYGGLVGAGAGVLVGGLLSTIVVPGESWSEAALPRLTVGGGEEGTTLGATLTVALPFPARRSR